MLSRNFFRGQYKSNVSFAISGSINFSRSFTGSTKMLVGSNLAKFEGSNTILHTISKTSTTTQQFADRISEIEQEYSKEQMRQMSVMTNDEGNLPSDLLKRNPTQQLSSHELLITLMARNETKPSSEPINIDKVLKGYYPNTSIYNNLRLACEIGNVVREEIKDSYTHPTHNITPKNSDEDILRYIDTRLKIDTLIRLENKGPVDGLGYIACEAEKIKLHAVGNCGEYSLLAAHYFQENAKNCYAPVYEVVKGDHQFNIFSDDPSKCLAPDLKDWKEAVVLDAWTGSVFPVSESETNLCAYRQINYLKDCRVLLNVLTPLNPNFHKRLKYFTSNFNLEEFLTSFNVSRALSEIVSCENLPKGRTSFKFPINCMSQAYDYANSLNHSGFKCEVINHTDAKLFSCDIKVIINKSVPELMLWLREQENPKNKTKLKMHL